MAVQPKKAKLLDAAQFEKERKKKQQQAAIARQQALIQQKMAALQAAETAEIEAQPTEKSSSKVKIYLLAFLLLTLMVLPYPKVIVYEKLGIVAESVYIPSRFGSKDFFLDANAEVNIDDQQRWLYICNEIQGDQNCQRYDIVEIKGIFSVIGYFISR
ncbi:hypothetical protein [Catenovulum maritimum]|uniref:Uncharacterized protein n=1 Tax=Catenovulum maritimum TaxID=1513271 RepID=A0A0J8GYF8_9ALTE|nr:hypothetical protein [Catenovulum maritimum]KMT65763.1 hypothetical protein XM47_07090 [Catenovulum maritimum]